MNRILRVRPKAGLQPFLADGEVVAFNVGPEGHVYLVIALRPLDYRVAQPGWAIFPKTEPDQAQKYRVIALSGDRPILDVIIERERFNIHDVQPLGDDLLLVCARSHYRGPKDFDKNGRVYTRGGKFLREMLLGDGIQSVQATSKGKIWTGFFDEGVFGNFGWEEPVGESGLVAWNPKGKKVYAFQPPKGLDAICHCYALNVESEEDVWCHYDGEIPLVHIHRNKVKSFWKVPGGGSDAFAVSKGRVLFRGGDGERDWYSLFSLEDAGQTKEGAKIQLQGPDGNNLIAEWAAGRGDAIHLIGGGSLYRIDVQSVKDVPETSG